MSEDKKYYRYVRNESSGKEAQYVIIANPYTLGMKIAIGMFIMFPVFLLGLFIFLTIFGGIFSSLLVNILG